MRRRSGSHDVRRRAIESTDFPSEVQDSLIVTTASSLRSGAIAASNEDPETFKVLMKMSPK